DSNVGAVYVYYGGSSIDESFDLLINAPASSVRFGAALASGDIDNDGYDDLIVGDPAYSSSEGRVYLYWGSSSFDGTVDVTFSAPDSSGKFGFAIATGDLNAATDSYDDIVITAPAYTSNDGRAYVYFGNTSGNMDTSNDGVLDPLSSGEAGRFGHAVAVGQFNGTGTDEDVFIGEPWYDIGSITDAGRSYIFIGGAGSSFDETADNTSQPNTDYEDGRFGYSIAVADYDNDGDDDVWIGAPYSDWPGFPMRTNCGFIYRVNAGGDDADPDWSAYYDADNVYLGISVAGGRHRGGRNGGRDRRGQSEQQ
ncbi:MAG: FG-GAP repeat protein, partial [Thermoplasmata archaeon]